MANSSNGFADQPTNTALRSNDHVNEHNNMKEQEDFIAFAPSDEEINVTNTQGITQQESRKEQIEEKSPENRGKHYRDRDREQDESDDDDYRNRAKSSKSQTKHGKKRARSPSESDSPSNQRSKTWRDEAAMDIWREKEAPWAIEQQYLGEPAERLHQEIVDFISYISPSPEEHEMRLLVVKQIEQVVEHLWHDAKLYIFGSYETQIYLPTSDIDVVITAPHLTALDKHRLVDELYYLSNTLKRKGIAAETRVVARAKVPIIKMVEAATGYHLDISLNITNGISSARTVKRFIEQMPALRPIMLLVKQFLTQRSMNEVFSGGLGSYSLMIMTVSFLQMHPLVQTKQIQAEENLGTLFMEFLELYGRNFAYENVGIRITKNGSYYRKRDMGRLQPNVASAPSLEDPNDSSNDVGVGSFNMHRVRQAFNGAFEKMKMALVQSIRDPRASQHPTLLSHIINIQDRARNHRLQVAEVYLNGEMHRTLNLNQGFTADSADNRKTNAMPITSRAAQKAPQISYVDESDEDFEQMAKRMTEDQGFSDDFDDFVGGSDEHELTLSATHDNSSRELDSVVQKFSVRIPSATSGSTNGHDSNSEHELSADEVALETTFSKANNQKQRRQTNKRQKQYKNVFRKQRKAR
ncbi:hypothetical protein BDF19DRAFT_436638 [Syncephalis fuscata]|nr:hypothetical protein BDF19DRAFT_436638 [Syncephalis fuscata]